VRQGAMVNFVRRKILGKWREGFCLDLHTLSSVFVGYDEFGHPRFDTQRSEVGELLYRLKNKGDKTAAPEIVEAVGTLMKAWNPSVDILVPVPPSTQRTVQPVLVLAEAISQQLGIPLAACVKRTRDVPQLKNVFDLDERSKLLEGLHTVDKLATQGKRVLLFDDLYRSGATMNAITTELYDTGETADVFALTITRTRSNQ
jgi:competence protein ComFC